MNWGVTISLAIVVGNLMALLFNAIMAYRAWKMYKLASKVRDIYVQLSCQALQNSPWPHHRILLSMMRSFMVLHEYYLSEAFDIDEFEKWKKGRKHGR